MNLYTYCGNNTINKGDSNGHIPEWGWWVLGGVVVIACLASTIITAEGFTAGGVAIYSAMCGIAYGSEAIAISSFAFVGAASIYIGALAYNALNIGTAKIRGSSYKTAFDDFLSMGDDVFFATLLGGITGGIGGKVVYDDQRRGLGHSWTKERNDFFKKSDLQKSDYVLHHPYGRHGANIRYYYPVTPEEHKMIHHTLGYGRGQGGFNQYREYVNWWKEIISRF